MNIAKDQRLTDKHITFPFLAAADKTTMIPFLIAVSCFLRRESSMKYLLSDASVTYE